MNRTAFTQRFTAFTLALLMTLGTLGTVDHLATSEPHAAELARTSADAARG